MFDQITHGGGRCGRVMLLPKNLLYSGWSNSEIEYYDMSKRKEGQAHGQYTLEIKLEAVRLLNAGQVVSVTAKILVVPTQTLGN